MQTNYPNSNEEGSGVDRTRSLVENRLIAKRYLIKMVLGEDALGVDHLAFDRDRERNVILKLIMSDGAGDSTLEAALDREMDVVRRVQDDHIVRLHSFESDSGLIFAVYEYVQGVKLRELLKEKGRLGADEAVRLVRQIARGLDRAHKETPTVVHGGLTPSSVVVTEDGGVKLANFGICRAFAIGKGGDCVPDGDGGAVYRAPERILENKISPEGDIYSLAAIACEILAGSPPAARDKIRIPGAADHVVRAIKLALSRDADVRPRTAGEFAAMLAGEIPVPNIKTEKSDLKKRPSLSVLLLVLLLLTCAGAGWYFFGGAAWRSGDGALPTARVIVRPPPAVAFRPIPPPPEEKVVLPVKALKPPVGVLAVTSLPNGAMVYVDGKKIGSTPVTLDPLESGERVIQVKKTGFTDWEHRVTISSGETVKLLAELAVVYGSIEITSRPASADVYLDGRKQGRTPLKLDRVTEGEKTIEVKKKGYAAWSQRLKVASGKTRSITAVLAVARSALTITSTPSGADVLVGGKRKGLTPLTIRKLRVGTATVTASKTCFKTVVRKVRIPAGKPGVSHFDLPGVCGRTVVSTNPPGAKWFFDGVYQGRTPGAIEQVPAGEHRVEIVKIGFIDWRRKVTVAPEDKTTIHAELLLLPPNAGDYYKDPVAGIEFFWVRNGCYRMGSTPLEPGRGGDEAPVHEACLDGFWIGIFEVTQKQWETVTGNNPAFFSKGDTYPVENISWNDAQQFVQTLNRKSGGKAVYRLPTEAEWEYACRSEGRQELFAGSDQIKRVAWYKRNSKRTTHKVGLAAPNNIDVYDMSGNVGEWVADDYAADAYAGHKKYNPLTQGTGADKVYRGGSWSHAEKMCRSAARSRAPANTRADTIGLRLVKVR